MISAFFDEQAHFRKFQTNDMFWLSKKKFNLLQFKIFSKMKFWNTSLWKKSWKTNYFNSKTSVDGSDGGSEGVGSVVVVVAEIGFEVEEVEVEGAAGAGVFRLAVKVLTSIFGCSTDFVSVGVAVADGVGVAVVIVVVVVIDFVGVSFFVSFGFGFTPAWRNLEISCFGLSGVLESPFFVFCSMVVVAFVVPWFSESSKTITLGVEAVLESDFVLVGVEVGVNAFVGFVGIEIETVSGTYGKTTLMWVNFKQCKCQLVPTFAGMIVTWTGSKTMFG